MGKDILESCPLLPRLSLRRRPRLDAAAAAAKCQHTWSQPPPLQVVSVQCANYTVPPSLPARAHSLRRLEVQEHTRFSQVELRAQKAVLPARSVPLCTPAKSETSQSLLSSASLLLNPRMHLGSELSQGSFSHCVKQERPGTWVCFNNLLELY